LRSFSRDWRNAKFDKGDLDDSISASSTFSIHNHFDWRGAGCSWNDVEQLRRMREAYDRHEIGRWYGGPEKRVVTHAAALELIERHGHQITHR